MLRKLLTLALITMSFLVSGTALAQQATPLTLGTPVEGEISAAEEQDVYTYQGRAGETVEIRVTSLPGSGLDIVLELYDSLNTSLMLNDDRAPGDSNSAITFTFEFDDTYQIIVRGYARLSTGAYEVVINAGQSPVVDLPPAGSVALDQTVTGTLESGFTGTWTFTPLVDADYQIHANSADFDIQVRVLDAAGVEIAFDDDSGGELNAYISRAALQVGETYTLEVRSYLDEGSGSYDLTVKIAPQASAAIPIKYGDTMEAELAPGLETRFVFEGQADDVVSVMIMSDFDAYLELQDSSGSVIAADDDSAGNLQPLIDTA
ncbi:MAG: pre-peptidase C-terminal domain-containing protein, partial [Anaerolineae bacterium]|nr:pre-peptidase C-terminal domain-containing protein [Anaerolineae bacterium]